MVSQLCCHLSGGAFPAIWAIDDIPVKDACGKGFVGVDRHMCPVAKVGEFVCLCFEVRGCVGQDNKVINISCRAQVVEESVGLLGEATELITSSSYMEPSEKRLHVAEEEEGRECVPLHGPPHDGDGFSGGGVPPDACMVIRDVYSDAHSRSAGFGVCCGGCCDLPC